MQIINQNVYNNLNQDNSNYYIYFRAERDRANIYSELQQTRGAVELVGREKVQRSSLVEPLY